MAGLLLLIVVSIGCGWIFRRLRCPGWAVVGGVVAGITLGPSLLGRLAPGTFEAVFIGGVVERQVRDSVRSRQGADLLAARTAGLDAVAIEEIQTRHQQELDEVRDVYDEATWQHQRSRRFLVALVAGSILLAAGSLRERECNRSHGLVAPLSIGLWSAAVPASLAVYALVRWWDHDVSAALLAGAAVGVGPAMLTADDRRAADGAEIGGAHLLQTAGRVASIAALLAVAGGLHFGDAWDRLPWTLPLLALPLGWVMPKPRVAARLLSLLQGLLVPPLVALVLIGVELFQHTSFWLLLLIPLISGDVRWLGALIGALLPGGRTVLRTMRLVLGASGCGPTQLAITAIALHCRLLPEATALALLAGVVVIEVTAPTRRTVARRLAETEEEMGEMD